MTSEKIVYLDYNSTTPLDTKVFDEMAYAHKHYYANPASTTHLPGWISNSLLDNCRKKVASLIEAEPESIIFTSGASEANNTILNAIAQNFYGKSTHFIISSIEHKCILNHCKVLEKQGVQISYIPVLSSGKINLDKLKEEIRPHTVFISIMAANNETGVLQPIEEVCALTKEKNILFHSDSAQFIGKMPFSVKKVPLDFMSFSSHKFYGPKGVGAIYCADLEILQKFPLIYGGGQEMGIRAGTVNVPGIVGMAKAAEIAALSLNTEIEKFSQMKKHFLASLRERIINVEIVGDEINSLPNTINFIIPGIDSKEILNMLKEKIALSTGSACSSFDQRPSHVLSAMGIEDNKIKASFRLSFGRFTTNEDLSAALDYFVDAFSKFP